MDQKNRVVLTKDGQDVIYIESTVIVDVIAKLVVGAIFAGT